MNQSSLHLAVPVTLQGVSDAGARIALFLQSVDVDPSTAFQVRLAAVEVMSNIVRHGFDEPGPEHAIAADLVCADGAIRLRIEDEGAPPPQTAPRPLDELPVEEIGGRGIAIVHSVMDSVRYCGTGGHNIVEMVKRVTNEAPS